MQYKIGTVNLTNGSTTVVGNGTTFQGNAATGNSFKVSGENAVYQVIAVHATLQEITISPAYAGATQSAVRYQIGRDRTPNLGLAEINAGDEDWPYWLTQEVIRKLDAAYMNFLHPRLADLQDVYVGPTEPTDPEIQFWIDTSGA